MNPIELSSLILIYNNTRNKTLIPSYIIISNKTLYNILDFNNTGYTDVIQNVITNLNNIVIELNSTFPIYHSL